VEVEQEVVVRVTPDVDLFHLFIKDVPEFIDVCPVLCRNEHTVLVCGSHPGPLQLFQRQVLPVCGAEIILILFNELVGVDLVEHHDGRLVEGSNVVKGGIDRTDLVFEAGMGDVDDMYQDVGFPDLVEG